MAGLSGACGLLATVGVHTTWSIDAVSAKHRKWLCSQQTTCHDTDFYAALHLSRRTSSSSLHSSIFISFISIFHLLPQHPPPVLLSLSLYLNITPYLAGVASRHSNRTVQSPWGLWDIVSCWNRTVCMHLWMCRVYVFPSELNVCMRTCKGSYKSQWLLLDLGCGVSISLSSHHQHPKPIAQSPPKTY